MKDKTMLKIKDLLRSHKQGLTISEVMKKTGLARHTVLSRLHALVGKGRVKIRKINMAKIHYWVTKHSKAKIKKSKNSVKIQPLKKIHIKPMKRGVRKTMNENSQMDIASIKQEIQNALNVGKIGKTEAQIKEQRLPITHVVNRSKHGIEKKKDEYIKTGIPGFDDLLDEGIPRGSAILIAGGAGSGKSIMDLQILYHHASHGEKCLFMSFEESEERLIHHMEHFGWDPKPLIKKGNLLIKRFNPFDITRSVDALLMKAKGELLIDIEPIIFPQGFKPDILVVDSLTAVASAFTGKEDSYRIYIEQLFRFLEEIHATSFLITETKQIPTIFSQSGVEEFLADGVIVLYNVKRGNVRENAVEVLKLRGASHQKKIVAMQITDNGIVVYPDQEVFSEIEG